MKNREIIMRRLERSRREKLRKIHFFLNRGGSREQVEEVLITMRESISDAKAFVQQEPLGPGEINQY